MDDKKDEKGFSELIEYLDGKFTVIDGKFDVVDEKFTAIDEKFNVVGRELATIKEDLVDINEKLDQKADKSDIGDLLSAVDAYAKRADTYFQEMVMLSHKVDRHEKWFHLLADKLGVKLDY